MIHTEVDIVGKQESIFQPIMMGVLKDLKLMIFGALDVPVRVGYRNIDKHNRNWMLGNIRRRNLHKSHDVMLTATYNTVYDENQIVAANMRTAEELPVMYDINTGLTVRSVKLPAKGVMELNIFFKSKGELEAVISKLRRRALKGRLNNFHTVQYILQIPGMIQELFYLHHKYRNHALELTETFEEFLSPLMDIRFTYTSDQHIDDRMEYGFKEQLSGVLGEFTPELLNLPMSFDNSTGYWSTTIEYSYHFTVPDVWKISYRPVIYNFLLPGKYRTQFGFNNTLRGLMNINQSSLMERYVGYMYSVNYRYVHIPETDTHIEFKDITCYRPLFSMLTLINKDDLRSLVNLIELGEFELTEAVRDFLLAGEYQYITEALNSIFNLTLFDTEGHIIPVELTVDSELNVSAVTDLDITKTYRLLFSSYMGNCKLTSVAIQRAKLFTILDEEFYTILNNKYPDGIPYNNGSIIELPIDYEWRRNLYEGNYFNWEIYSTIITRRLEEVNDGFSE